MKRLALAALLVLGACKSDMLVDSRVSRAELFRTCENGSKVVRDPVDGRLLLVHDSWATIDHQLIAPGVTAEQACGDPPHAF